MDYYTYIHQTTDGRVFYVGKGKDRRAWAKNKRSTYWQRMVKKHGLRVQIAARWPTEQEAFDHEKFLVWCFRDMGVQLANLTDGGEGSSGWQHAAETVAKIKASNIGKKRSVEAVANSRAARAEWLERGIHEYWTPERRQAARSAVAGERHPNYGKTFSPELRAKLSAAHTGKLNNASSKPVLCVDTGKVFPSSEEAARWLQANGKPKASGSAINAVALGRHQTAYGYRWERT
jgi:hypothetical protein